MALLPGPAALLAYLGATVALVLTPGPDTAFVLAQSVGGGRAAGIRAAAGVNVGILVHTVLAALGLSALFRVAPTAYTVVKFAGAAYLVYLGIQTLRGAGGIDVETPTAAGSFRQGLATNVLNPKVALFFLAFLPQFGQGIELLPLGALYALVGFAYLGSVALASGRARDLLVERAEVQTWLRRLSGSAMLALGGALLFEDGLPV